MHPRTCFVAVAFSLLASGCTTVGPDFHKPDVPWLEQWHSTSLEPATAGPQQSPPPPVDDWWRVFNDPVLDQLVAEAQRLNPGVRTAGLRIMEARAQLGIAGSALYPQLQQLSAEVLQVGKERSQGRD